MWPWLIGSGVVGVVGVWALLRFEEEHPHEYGLSHTDDLARLAQVHELAFRGNVARGTVSGFGARIEVVRDEDELLLTTAAVNLDGDPGAGQPSAAMRRVFRSSAEVGDPQFDAGIDIEGDAPLLLALFNAATRHNLVAKLAGARVRIRGHAVAVTAHAGPVLCLEVAMALGGRLATLDTGDALASLVESDPHAAVRFRALEHLNTHFAGERTAAVTQHALGDPDPTVRLRAAKILNDEGVLTELVCDSTLTLRLRRDAVLATHDLDEPQAVRVLGRALRTDSLELQLAVIRSVRGRRLSVLIPQLWRLVRRVAFDRESGSLDLVLEVASCASVVGGADAEQMLIELLNSPRKPVQREAVLGLGVIGSGAAVEPLRQTPGMSRYALHAIENIHARIGGGGMGGALTLIDPIEESGALTIVEVSGGLTLTDDVRSSPSGS